MNRFVTIVEVRLEFLETRVVWFWRGQRGRQKIEGGGGSKGTGLGSEVDLL